MTDEDLFKRSADLDDRLKGVPLDEMVHRLTVSGRRNRHLIRLVTVGLALDIALSAAALGAYANIRHLSERTARLSQEVATNSESITAACQARNHDAAKQLELWNFVVHLSQQSQPKQTPAQHAATKQQTEVFLTRLRQIFAPEKCPNVRGKP